MSDMDGLLKMTGKSYICNTSSAQDPPVTLESMKAAMAKLKEQFPKPLPKQVIVATAAGQAWLESQMPKEYGSALSDLLYGIPIYSFPTEWEAWKVALDYNEDGFEVIFLKDSGGMHQLAAGSVAMMIEGQWNKIGKLAGPIQIEPKDGLTNNQRKRRAKRIRLIELYANRRASLTRGPYVIRDRLLKRWGLPVTEFKFCTSPEVVCYAPVTGILLTSIY